MAEISVNVRLKQKYDTSSNWGTANPILLAGEIGIESDTNKIKIGDGATNWNDLSYINGSSDGNIILLAGTEDNPINLGELNLGQLYFIKGWYSTYGRVATKFPTDSRYYLCYAFNVDNNNRKSITIYGYFMATSSYRGTDSISYNSGTTVITGPEYGDNVIYFSGLDRINGNTHTHNQSIYAPTTSGTLGQILQSNGANNAPIWIDNITIDTELSETSTNPVQNNIITTKLQQIEELIPTTLSELTEDTTHRLVTDTEKATWNSKSEFSGSYNDLTDKPTIPTNNNQLTNGAGYVTQTEIDNAVATKTAVNVDNQFQSTLDFDSDPQTQLDNLANRGIGIELSSIKGTLTQEQFDTLDGDDNNYIILTVGSNSWIYRLTEKDSKYSIYMRTARADPINFGGLTLGVDYVSINRNTLSYTFHTLCPYPMGSIYISVENVSPAGIVGGTWEALLEGYTLWTTTTSGQGGQTIEAGLPNIEGNVYSVWNSTTFDNTSTYEGALSLGGQVTRGSQAGSGYADYLNSLDFDASQSNSIYGNSTTVQPPAIKVYMWKRVD